MCTQVETIGDSYFCASGLEHDDPDHANSMVRFALDMVAQVGRGKDRQ